MKTLFDLVAFLLLALAMVLQFNDPDPWFWASFYFICSLIPLLAVFNIYSKVLFWLGVAFCAAATVLTLDGGMEYLRHTEESLMQGMSADKPYIEETRELLGTLIALVIISVYPFRNLKKH